MYFLASASIVSSPLLGQIARVMHMGAEQVAIQQADPVGTIGKQSRHGDELRPPHGDLGNQRIDRPHSGQPRADQTDEVIEDGTVAINSSMILDFNSPFGGFKKSGIGRELGPEGIAPYTELQTVILPAG